MKWFIILCSVLLAFSGCGIYSIRSYQVEEIRKVSAEFALVKTTLPYEDSGYSVVFPGFICELDTTLQIGSRRSVESYFHNDSLIVVQEQGGKLDVFTYDAEKSLWRHVSNYRAEKDSLIRRSGSELEYPPLSPVEEAEKITFDEFLEYPGWRRCD